MLVSVIAENDLNVSDREISFKYVMYASAGKFCFSNRTSIGKWNIYKKFWNFFHYIEFIES